MGKVGAAVWVLLPMLTNGFLHERSAVLYHVESSLFGYSLEYLPSRKSLIVGAPNEQETGSVFQVNLSDQSVKQLNISAQLGPQSDRGYWLGASLKAVNDGLVVCAPRYTQQISKKYKPIIVAQCFESDSTLENFHTMPSTTLLVEKKVSPWNKMFGWSLETTSEGHLLLGNPADKGDVIQYDSLWSKPGYINNQSPMQNYGYSIVCGDFSPHIKCAVSSTYGDRGYGRIHFYDASFSELHKVTDDEHVGAMFGAALCRVDLGGPHHHLLVGAPLSRNDINAYDVGAVYLYVKHPSDDNKMVHLKSIQGSKNGGYFGNAIISLGDMDGDGKDANNYTIHPIFPEVAVGAPYENEHQGAVYIYTGAELSNLNSKNQPAQVIRPKKLLYFGHSLAVIKDYDDNGSNELAIGAPESNTVVVYRSFASVKIDIEVILLNTTRLESVVNVSFQTCLRFTYPKKPESVRGDIQYRVEIQNGIYQSDIEIVLRKILSRSCKNHSVSVVETEQQLLTYVVKDISLKEDPEALDIFDPTRVLISIDEPTKTGTFSISDCGKGVCNPDLKINIETSIPNMKYAIGSSKSEWFSMIVHNAGDTAYAPCVEVEVVGASILKPGSCSFKEKVSGQHIVCTPRRALRNGTNWEIEKVLLETSGMTSSDETLEIHYDVLSYCDKPEDRQTHTLTVALQRDQNFTIMGSSSPDSVIGFTPGNIMNENKSISHVYKIQNDGLTNWVGIKSRISLPVVEHATYQIFIVRDGVYRVCPITDAALSVGSVECDVGNVDADRFTSVYVNIKVAPSLLGLVEKTKETSTLTTSLQVILKGATVPDVPQSVTTTFQLVHDRVALWIIILAGCVGLLILIIIAFALYKCGFLRRREKAKLQRLQNSVYRQSIRKQYEGKEADVYNSENCSQLNRTNAVNSRDALLEAEADKDQIFQIAEELPPTKNKDQ